MDAAQLRQVLRRACARVTRRAAGSSPTSDSATAASTARRARSEIVDRPPTLRRTAGRRPRSRFLWRRLEAAQAGEERHMFQPTSPGRLASSRPTPGHHRSNAGMGSDPEQPVDADGRNYRAHAQPAHRVDDQRWPLRAAGSSDRDQPDQRHRRGDREVHGGAAGGPVEPSRVGLGDMSFPRDGGGYTRRVYQSVVRQNVRTKTAPAHQQSTSIHGSAGRWGRR